MTQSKDFKVEQTCNELWQAVYNAAYHELVPPRSDPEWMNSYDTYGREAATRIANDFVSGLDAAE